MPSTLRVRRTNCFILFFFEKICFREKNDKKWEGLGKKECFLFLK